MVVIDGYHKPNLDLIRDMAVNQGFSPVICYTGMERAGKSTCLSHDALYIDPTIQGDLERVAFTIPQFQKAIEKARSLGPGKVVILDEAINIFSAGESRGKIARQLERILMMNGKYNIIYMLAVPSIFDLSPYIRLHRVDFLVHIKIKDIWDHGKKQFQLKRGGYVTYSFEQKLKLLMFAKYKYDMRGAYINYYGRFDKHPTPTEVYGIDYETKKDQAIAEAFTEKRGRNSTGRPPKKPKPITI